MARSMSTLMSRRLSPAERRELERRNNESEQAISAIRQGSSTAWRPDGTLTPDAQAALEAADSIPRGPGGRRQTLRTQADPEAAGRAAIAKEQRLTAPLRAFEAESRKARLQHSMALKRRRSGSEKYGNKSGTLLTGPQGIGGVAPGIGGESSYLGL